MEELSKREFYALIGPRDIIVKVLNEKETLFTTRGGDVLGKVVYHDENDSSNKTYYLDTIKIKKIPEIID